MGAGPTFWFSIILIVVGIFLLLDNLNIFYIDGLWDYWPLILVAVGIYRLLSSGFRDIYSSILFILGGFLLFLLTTDVIYFRDIWRFWPLILILIGARIIYNKVILTDEKRKGITVSDDRIDHVAIFGGKEKRVASDNFQGGNITAIFGGVELYFENAKLAEGSNVLDILVMFGGTEIYVPRDWMIVTKGLPIFGGFEDARKNPPKPDASTKGTLIVKGLVLFGGLEIKDA